jgi:hypothetical protein
MNTATRTHDSPQARRHAVSVGCRDSERSRIARAAHAATVAAFVRAGHGALLTGATLPTAEIVRVYCELMPGTAADWDDAETSGLNFDRFVRRNRAWVAAIVDGAA